MAKRRALPKPAPAQPPPNPQTSHEDTQAMLADVLGATRTICVWRFDDAPPSLQRLARRQDGAWIAFIPEPLVETFIPWIDFIDDISQPERHRLAHGAVAIGGSFSSIGG